MDNPRERKARTPQVLPRKSLEQYKKSYELFKEWCADEGYKSGTNEDMLLAYLEHLVNDKSIASSRVWPKYSHLKQQIQENEGKDISVFEALRSYCKAASKGDVKKAPAFTREQILKFLATAPDEAFLTHKVAAILTIFGALKKSELHGLRPEDVVFRENKIELTIQGGRVAKIESTAQLDAVGIVRRYDDLVRMCRQRDAFLMRLYKMKVNNQIVGINRLARFPKEIAEFLKLPEHETYTNRSQLQLSATFLANQGIPKSSANGPNDTQKHTNTKVDRFTCRACSGRGNSRYYYSLALPEVQDLFTGCTAIEILPEEDECFPQQLCSACYDKCKEWRSFKEMCQKVDKRLQRKAIENFPIQEDEVPPIRIKEELMDVDGFSDVESFIVGEVFKEEEEEPEEKCPEEPAEHEDIEQCPVCDMVLLFSPPLKEHLKTHYTEENPKCPICDEHFNRSSKIYPHIMSLHKRGDEETQSERPKEAAGNLSCKKQTDDQSYDMSTGQANRKPNSLKRVKEEPLSD